MMNATVICLFEDGPPHSWGSLLGEGSTSLKTDFSPESVELSSEL